MFAASWALALASFVFFFLFMVDSSENSEKE